MKNKKLYALLVALCVVTGVSAQQDNVPAYDNDGRHKGLDFNIQTGYHVGVGDSKGTGSVPIEIGVGKQFSRRLYFGIGSGVWLSTKEGDPMVPITGNVKLMFPSQTRDMKPVLNVNLGYLVNTAGGEIEGIKYDGPDFVLMELLPGLQFPISSRTDFVLSAGYTHGFATKGGGSAGFFTIKAGLNFHRNPNWKRRPPREKVPTRNKGLQFTLEGFANKSEDWGYGANLVCTYKLNPHFSVGGGVGYEMYAPFADIYPSSKSEKTGDIQLVYVNSSGVREEYYDYGGDGGRAINLFARGVYRLTDRRFSPFVSVDAGVRLCSFQNFSMQTDELEGPKETLPFVAPAIGVSLRTTRNSYIELKGGYAFEPNVLKAQKAGLSDGSYISTGSQNHSRLFISLGFTHTFGKRGKRPAY